MSGKSSRDCGYRGEVAAQALLASRDWTDITRRPPGEKGSDLQATSPKGIRHSCEVKNTVAYTPRYWEQCVRNAKKDGMIPLLLWYCKDRSRQWHVKTIRDGKPHWAVWSE